MIFEDRTMAANQEKTIQFRCDEETQEWLFQQAGHLDVSVSALCRAAVLLAVAQLKSMPSLLNVRLQDIRKEDKSL